MHITEHKDCIQRRKERERKKSNNKRRRRRPDLHSFPCYIQLIVHASLTRPWNIRRDQSFGLQKITAL